jgi:hypothetical protein
LGEKLPAITEAAALALQSLTRGVAGRDRAAALKAQRDRVDALKAEVARLIQKAQRVHIARGLHDAQVNMGKRAHGSNLSSAWPDRPTAR